MLEGVPRDNVKNTKGKQNRFGGRTDHLGAITRLRRQRMGLRDFDGDVKRLSDVLPIENGGIGS